MVLRDGFAGRSADELKTIWAKAENFAKDAVENEPQSIDTVIPLWMTAPVYSNVPTSGRRFLSLTSPDSPQEPGADDMFSSDLSNEELGKSFWNDCGEGIADLEIDGADVGQRHGRSRLGRQGATFVEMEVSS
ncbi:hypothetical protein LLEC1_03240 [Akanthomyces lecanii]|uniref:Uncharacterized protein n=1 Tax=Cordyceps confragosa TaxID=2714763 RepID=A0A179ISJ7_CORDF|nr:hypothetical protein LLEC1_03240 [Akanthomyces lecanii]